LGLGTLYFGQNTEIREDQLFLNHTDSKLTLSVLQHVRLGSRDGLHFESSSAVRLDLHSWSFGWFEGSVQIPVSSRSWFLLRSSGGTDPGYVYTELGFRRLVRGNGAGGSLFVRPSAGFSGISSPEHSGDFVLGPMLGLHLEARLAR
jgi:hypothetical protein